ncbi:hypothetical protein C8Q77DRAFT_1062562 [Trametes polyzona]|nr:hypothetical protein C8Q77DRAFT_1062562 [Trametes polyzona]
MSGSQWLIRCICKMVQERFNKRACSFQIKIAQALHERCNNAVAVAATGAGKTLSFWISLLMALENGEDRCIIVITPLNILGKQNFDLLADTGLIKCSVHHVIILNPELDMQEGDHCEKLWGNSRFLSWLLYVVFDNGHCIKEWSSFREQYKYMSTLHHTISKSFPFYIAYATLPPPPSCQSL